MWCFEDDAHCLFFITNRFGQSFSVLKFKIIIKEEEKKKSAPHHLRWMLFRIFYIWIFWLSIVQFRWGINGIQFLQIISQSLALLKKQYTNNNMRAFILLSCLALAAARPEAPGGYSYNRPSGGHGGGGHSSGGGHGGSIGGHGGSIGGSFSSGGSSGFGGGFGGGSGIGGVCF